MELFVRTYHIKRKIVKIHSLVKYQTIKKALFKREALVKHDSSCYT